MTEMRSMPAGHARMATSTASSGRHKEARGTYHVKRRDVAEAKRRGEPCCPHLTIKTTAPTVAEILDDFLVYSKATKRAYKHDAARAKRLPTASALAWLLT